MFKWVTRSAAVIICCLMLSCISPIKEHKEAANLPIANIDFSRINDGTYIGTYEGGMYQWRENEVRITISLGKVTKIELLKSKEERPAEFTDTLYNRVIEKQSLHVDAISGATLTSKAFLKAIENALSKAIYK